ncbi:MAG TPA: hypothetical protein VKK19_17120 [Candidatus Dormibacteraeota bacterium]|nr:hypothetical protein [Candidatus Dormibacteraeota bacterium]
MIAIEVTQSELEDLYWALGVLRGVAETTSSPEMRHRLDRVDQLLRGLIQEELVT